MKTLIQFLFLSAVLVVLGGMSPAFAQNSARDAKQHYLDTLKDRGRRSMHPVISEADVRAWFTDVTATFKERKYKQVSLFKEFHPIDGNLMAIYKHKKEMVFVSYVDDNRKDPDFGLPRSAREIVATGIGGGSPDKRTLAGRTWYGADGSGGPIIATEIAPDVKVVLLGYAKVSLKTLYELAETLPLDKLVNAAR